MALLVETRAELHRRSVASEIIGAPEQLRAVITLYGGDQHTTLRPIVRQRMRPIDRLGAALDRLAREAHSLVVFTGGLLQSFAGSVRKHTDVNWRSVPGLIVRGGTEALQIVLLLNFLIGFVMAYQSMQTLKVYGANVFVADIVGISVTRELAPLITAVIITGRSGASFAAELGSMRVSEEIDALRTMGFSPLSHLVVPRVISLAVVAPILTLLGDVVGIGGGMFVGANSLGVTPTAFLSELRLTLVYSDVWTGLIKAFAFGIAIAFIGCRQGLITRGSASEVGRSTTTTVVRCLFTLVIIDTLLTVLFREYLV